MADRVDWQAEPGEERSSAYLRLLRLLRLFAAIPLRFVVQSAFREVNPIP
jgi:hypothetical protein